MSRELLDRESIAIELNEFATAKGWDPSITLLAACDLAGVQIAIGLEELDPKGANLIKQASGQVRNLCETTIEQMVAFPTVAVTMGVIDLLIGLVLRLAKERVK